jgi:phosphatidylserine/phosphatidylglycerophosphate/cardiolipin synthase-like enzyme/uncharacterized membrane protein YdjX (TVP38/TMEM64 family)
MSVPEIESSPENLFHAGRNCWRVEKATYVSMIVDYGNYYRDLRESIIKAKHSIFILGWDIDSRIELLRGKDAINATAPVRFFDLICWKAKKDPHVQIYLNKWNYSIFFFQQRELFWERKWKSCGLPNVHICLDGMIPIGACHHQKVSVIDDEIAYWGGMDVALGRWDFRQHHIDNPYRADPSGLPNPDKIKHFSPYHDIQAVLAGPAATALAHLVRTRWNLACDDEPIPLRPYEKNGVPQSWPDSDPPDFFDVDVAIARTIPSMRGNPEVQEIKHLFLDEISKAEKFIYIENQFLCCDYIADALNKRLHERPELQILAISCREPQGIMEKKSMWGGRLIFRDILERGNVSNRVALAYPGCQEHGRKDTVRIHSKLMIIDDRWMHVGSANMNNRSMGMDTECDIVIIGSHEAARKKIAAVRTDLIHEHCGRAALDIERIISTGEPVATLLEHIPGSHHHLEPINDERYRDEKFIALSRKIADPKRPFVTTGWTTLFHHGRLRRQLIRSTAAFSLAIIIILAISLMWEYTPLMKYASVDALVSLFEEEKESHFTILWVTLVYVIGGLVFFPVTVMTGATIIVFGGVKGFFISSIGATISSIVGYKIGQWVGLDNLRKISHKTQYALDKIKDSGVVGVAVIRTLPLAPFTLVNFVFGVSGVPLVIFVIGTFLGLLPGKITIAIFGDSFSDALKNPDPQNIFYAAIAFSAWLAVIFGCNWLAKQWQKKSAQRV